jgi:hypothetical protein
MVTLAEVELFIVTGGGPTVGPITANCQINFAIRLHAALRNPRQSFWQLDEELWLAGILGSANG